MNAITTGFIFFLGMLLAFFIIFLVLPTPKDYIEYYLNHPEKYEVIKIYQINSSGDTLSTTYQIIEINK